MSRDTDNSIDTTVSPPIINPASISLSISAELQPYQDNMHVSDSSSLEGTKSNIKTEYNEDDHIKHNDQGSDRLPSTPNKTITLRFSTDTMTGRASTGDSTITTTSSPLFSDLDNSPLTHPFLFGNISLDSDGEHLDVTGTEKKNCHRHDNSATLRYDDRLSRSNIATFCPCGCRNQRNIHESTDHTMKLVKKSDRRGHTPSPPRCPAIHTGIGRRRSISLENGRKDTYLRSCAALSAIDLSRLSPFARLNNKNRSNENDDLSGSKRQPISTDDDKPRKKESTSDAFPTKDIHQLSSSITEPTTLNIDTDEDIVDSESSYSAGDDNSPTKRMLLRKRDSEPPLSSRSRDIYAYMGLDPSFNRHVHTPPRFDLSSSHRFSLHRRQSILEQSSPPISRDHSSGDIHSSSSISPYTHSSLHPLLREDLVVTKKYLTILPNTIVIVPIKGNEEILTYEPHRNLYTYAKFTHNSAPQVTNIVNGNIRNSVIVDAIRGGSNSKTVFIIAKSRKYRNLSTLISNVTIFPTIIEYNNYIHSIVVKLSHRK